MVGTDLFRPPTGLLRYVFMSEACTFPYYTIVSFLFIERDKTHAKVEAAAENAAFQLFGVNSAFTNEPVTLWSSIIPPVSFVKWWMG